MLEAYRNRGVGMRLCQDALDRLKAGGVKVDIKDPYFKVISRQKQLDTTTWLAEVS